MRWSAPLLVLLPLAACVPGNGCDNGACPEVEALRDYQPPEATRLLAADGSHLADLSPQRRIVISVDEVPEVLREGFIAVEDRRFWQHRGVDARAVGRAAWRNLRAGGIREGSSTLTMQLARNVYPDALPRARRAGRKLSEARLALRIERVLTKAEILELYLNQIYLGSGFYGVEAAARGYFGRSAAELGPAESALLIALARSPEGYSPHRNRELARIRRDIVLGVMAREGVVDSATAAAARATALALAPPPPAAGSAPYYVAAVRRELVERYGPAVDVMGLRVHTTLDPAAQRAADAALSEQIHRIEAGSLGPFAYPVPSESDLAAADGASPFLQGMFIALDVRTGAVRALVGGRDFAHSQFDRAFQARRQPGSAFKPIVYAAALDRGLPLTASVDLAPITLAGGSDGGWRPRDPHADTLPSLRLRDAMALSSNVAAVRVGDWAGEGAVIGLARALGISTALPSYQSLHLGTAEVVPAELVAAFAAFANGGRRIRPRLVERIEDARGNLVWENRGRPSEPVLDPGVAYLGLSLLQDAVLRGTGHAAHPGDGLPVAGKTGTTNDVRDAWFVGVTPDLAAGVWLGFDRPRPIMAGGSGGRLAAPAWSGFVREWYRGKPRPQTWTPPATLVRVPVDTTSGERAGSFCPAELVVAEFFLPGTEPTETCSLHQGGPVERFLDRLLRRVRGR